jgi:hypothetical protein
MPCQHKFYEDLTLNRIDFVPATLIVGTFNPQWPDDNIAQWFYGRVPDNADDHNTGNHFWAVLPRLYGAASLKHPGAVAQWKAFCHQHQIAITDLVSVITDANPANPDHLRILGTYSDKAIGTTFHAFEDTPVTDILRNYPTIRNVYFTRSITDRFWRNRWNPIQLYCDAHQIRHRTLMTPSDYSRYQQGRYNHQNPNNPLNREDFILMRWHAQWH